jgi:TolB-like protein
LAGMLSTLTGALGDRYTIERELGRGGMATVYLAHDRKHDRLVALKVLRRDLSHVLGRERFVQEVRIVARLQHPHILPLFDSGEAAGQLWYTMPYVEGESLRQRIAREGQLPLDEAIRISHHVLAGLAYAHQQGIIHRDLKPENILLESGEAVVADFGIAHAVDAAGGEHLTESGLVLGTPTYMSPEQAGGREQVDARSDIYSFGCVLYEMLAGKPPFTATTPLALLARHALDPVPSVQRLHSGVPDNLDRAVMKALAKSPADRFATAAQFAEALEARVDARAPPRWRTAGLLGGFLIVAALAAMLVGRDRSQVIPSALVMAVTPFAPTGPDTALARLGRDLVVTLSANLDGVGDIRTVDALAILAQDSDPERIYTREAAGRLARRLGATSVLHGSLLRTNGDVRLEAVLLSTDQSEELARASVTAAAGDIKTLTDSATWAVLGQIWRTRTPPSPNLAAVTTHSVAALREFLDGERATFENRWAAAKAAYGRAIQADSTFWLAYWRYYETLGWQTGPGDPAVDTLIRRAFLEHRHALPERDRVYIEADYARFLNGRESPSLSKSLHRKRAVVERYPDYWFGLFDYGDNLLHFGPLVGFSAADAAEALERALVLMPRLAPAWEHLAVASLRRDTVAVARAVAALTQLGTEPRPWAAQPGFTLRLWRGIIESARRGRWGILGPAVSDTLASMLVESRDRDPHESFAVHTLSQGFPQAIIDISRRVLRIGVPPELARLHRQGMAMAWAARGQWDSAMAMMDAVSPSEAYRLTAVGSWLGAISPESASTRRRQLASGEQELTALDSAELFWLDGLLAAARRDQGELSAALQALRAIGDSAARLLEPTLTAHKLALTGDAPAAGRALAAFQERSDDREGDRFNRYKYARSVNRLAAARWLLAAGDTTRAARLLLWHQAEHVGRDSRGTQQVDGMLAGLAYLELGRIEAARERAELARGHYEQFLARYDLPPPAHRYLIEEAQAALRLERSLEEPGRAR